MKGLKDFPREDEASVSTKGRKEGKVFRDVEIARTQEAICSLEALQQYLRVEAQDRK